MSQFKDKSASAMEKGNTSGISIGLQAYPILMAADVLLYQPHFVPVGDDQKQHLNLIRDVCVRFNSLYKTNYFKHLPEPLGATHTATNAGANMGSRIMSLQNGSVKMSKSDTNDNSRINLLDNADTIAKKVKRCKSDNIIGLDINPPNDWDRSMTFRPEATNLLIIYSLLTNQSLDEVKVVFAQSNWSEFKNKLIEAMVAYLTPLQSRYYDLMKNKDYIENVLLEGSNYANSRANQSLSEIRNIMGFMPPIASKK